MGPTRMWQVRPFHARGLPTVMILGFRGAESLIWRGRSDASKGNRASGRLQYADTERLTEQLDFWTGTAGAQRSWSRIVGLR